VRPLSRIPSRRKRRRTFPCYQLDSSSPLSVQFSSSCWTAVPRPSMSTILAWYSAYDRLRRARISPRGGRFCVELLFHRATCVEFVEGTADRLASEASHGHATPTTAWRPAGMQPEGLCSSAVLRAIFLPCRGRTVASQFQQALGRWGNVSSFPSSHRLASTSQLIAFRSCCSNSLARTRARPLHHLQSSAEQHPHSHRPSGTATGARRWHGAAGMMRPT
jgi:hypothetical protein